MTAHNISFLYTGRMADAGAMDAAYFERAMAGARIALASHCHFVTSGRIPARVRVKTRDFRVVAAAPRYCSVDMLFLVVFTGAGLLAFKFLEGLASGIGEGMGRDFYKIVLSRTVRASFHRYADRRKLSYEEPVAAMRIEPHRPWQNEDQLRPQKDTCERREGIAPTGNIVTQYQKLSNMTDRSTVRIANPIGREGGSSGLEVRIDGESIVHLHERQPTPTDVRPQDDVYRALPTKSLEWVERELMLERTMAGLNAAPAEGRIGGRQRKLSPQDIPAARRHLSRDGVAEVAFAVDGDWRRQVIGSALLEAATRWAEQAGVATLRMVISRNNWPMRQLAHKAGARLDFDLDEIFADIAVATAASLDISA